MILSRLKIVPQILACFLLLHTAAATSQEQEKQQKKSANQNPSPMAEHIRTHERLPDEEPPGKIIEIPGVLPKAAELYIPADFHTSDPTILVIHFHGMGYIVRHSAHNLGKQFAAIAVNLGAGSSTYARPFSDPDTFMKLLHAAKSAFNDAGYGDVDFENIYLTSFSAGYGAVREILGQRKDMIDGVILLDSMHTGYIPSGVTLYEGGAVEGEGLAVFLDYARNAISGDVRLIVTHSCIFPGTYASTTECAQYIIDELGLKRSPVLEWGPLGMQLLGRTEQGNFKVLAFAGNTAPDHVDHLNALPYFLKMLLPDE